VTTGTTELLFASVLTVVAVLLPRLARTPFWVRAALDLAALLVLTFLVQRTLGSPLNPQFAEAPLRENIWQRVVEAGWWILAGRFCVGAARALIILENRPRETQIVSDLLAGAVYIAVFLAVINFAFSVPIRGLLATSGVIAIVLGLALQSTLSDVFSGIAVGIEKPYGVGDVLWVEGGIEGHVLQVNWRSTLIATGHDNVAIIPNSVIAKARLINRSAPTPRRGQTVEVRLDPATSPDACVAALTAAARACRLPLAVPAPSVACTGLHGDGGVYEISFSVASSADVAAASTELLTLVHRHLRYDGIGLAVAGSAAVSPASVPTPAQILAQSELFGVVDAAERDVLAQHFKAQRLQAGDTLVREGEPAEALFVLASGTVEVTVSEAGRTRVVGRMSPGASIGASGLIIGSSYGATATALTRINVFRLDREDISAAMKGHPALASALEALAARGLAALRGDAAARDEVKQAQPEMLQSRLRTLLRLLNRSNDES
jgi:small-conductance mechanosensitive channel/CRP-like cAMP-binding protein